MEHYQELFALLFDEGAYTELDKHYAAGGAVTAVGCINGVNVYAFSQNGGAFTEAGCQKIIKLYDLAVKTGAPVIGFYASDGVALKEGFAVCNAYGALMKKAFSVSGVVPQISVINGPCLGINAVMCNTADIVIGVAEQDFYVTSDAVGTTELASDGGVADILAYDETEAVVMARTAISYFPQNNLSPLPVFEFEAMKDAEDFVCGIADEGSVTELKAHYAENAETSLATLGGMPVGFIRFGGKPLCPQCAYKAEAMIKLCDAFGLPIITVADSEGVADSNVPATITALTKLASAYANATCPKISLITASSVGAAYILLAGKGANADMTLAWNTAIVSPLPAESAAVFLYDEQMAQGESREALTEEYKKEAASAETAAKCGVIDEIITPEQTREKLINALRLLASKRETTIPRKHTVK